MLLRELACRRTRRKSAQSTSTLPRGAPEACVFFFRQVSVCQVFFYRCCTRPLCSRTAAAAGGMVWRMRSPGTSGAVAWMGTFHRSACRSDAQRCSRCTASPAREGVGRLPGRKAPTGKRSWRARGGTTRATLCISGGNRPKRRFSVSSAPAGLPPMGSWASSVGRAPTSPAGVARSSSRSTPPAQSVTP